MSSRNNYLDDKESNIAPRLNQTIRDAKLKLESGSQDFDGIENEASRSLEKAGFVPDYVSIRNAQNLLPASPVDPDLVILAAAYLGKTRLIDNIQVNRSTDP
jgi:pantoate--beta-alanine ligase